MKEIYGDYVGTLTTTRNHDFAIRWLLSWQPHVNDERLTCGAVRCRRNRRRDQGELLSIHKAAMV